MPAEPIQYFNRYTRKLETEAIYGEKWLRLMYEKPFGKFLLWAVVKRALFSYWYGWQMSKRVSSNKVLPFVIDYNLKSEEFAKSPFEYRSFNEFFCRALKKEARPIADAANAVIFPADGRHLGYANVDLADGFYAKGQKFTLAELLGDAALAKQFDGGTMVISRLCPVDYHRFHFPFAGVASAPKLIKGALYSVSPIALRQNVKYLVQNKRMLTLLTTEKLGTVICMEIGATNVGTIQQTYAYDFKVDKGEQKGVFKFGGSCVVTLFEPGKVKLEADLLETTAKQIELYAKMGDKMATSLR